MKKCVNIDHNIKHLFKKRRSNPNPNPNHIIIEGDIKNIDNHPNINIYFSVS
jgi:hypothetical protein